MRLAAGLGPDPLGSYSAPTDSLAIIRGAGGREGKGLGIERGRKRREGVDVKGKGGMARGREGKEGGSGRVGKGKGGLDLDICPGGPNF